MNDIESLIVLVAAAVALVRLADVIAIPYPIVLVLGGLGIGFLPGGPSLDLDPEVIFLVFLPPLLQSAGYYSSPRELRAEAGPLTGLVVGLVLTTMVVVAAVAQALIPDLGWGEALVLGAILSPTDPVAAIATFGRVGISERVTLLIEGESMVNDAVGLVAYRVALSAVVAGSFAAGDAAVDLIVSVAGGVGIGLAIGWLAVAAFRRVDDAPLSILLSVLVAYVAFAICEEIDASGVLAVVTLGLYLGARSHEIYTADLRLAAVAFWQVLILTLNAIIFILLGLQFPDILERVGEQFSVGEIAGYGLLISAVVILVRIGWQFVLGALARVIPVLSRVAAGQDWRERLLIGWSGMRGAVSLAAALALPFELDSGAPLDDRDLIIYLTVAVILVTLVGQGLTLPLLVNWLRLGVQEPWSPDEAVARLAAAQAALDRIEELESSGDPIPETALERLRELYQARFARCVASLSGDGAPVPIENPLEGYRSARQELIGAERNALLSLRSEGRLKADVFRRIQRDLDLDEARLRS
ncbi:MAG TPA: Na+/H+ antiporter [Solirubrobacterales bacterium]|nr:Na+/H+ antiporter [Solirubrobacterales bacterium]